MILMAGKKKVQDLCMGCILEGLEGGGKHNCWRMKQIRNLSEQIYKITYWSNQHFRAAADGPGRNIWKHNIKEAFWISKPWT